MQSEETWTDKNGSPFEVGSRVKYTHTWRVMVGTVTGSMEIDGALLPCLEADMGACFAVLPEFVAVAKESPCPYCHDTAWGKETCSAGTVRVACQGCSHPAYECYCGKEGCHG